MTDLCNTKPIVLNVNKWFLTKSKKKKENN